MLALRETRGHFDYHLFLDPAAPIRTKEGAHGNLGARFHFTHFGPGVLDGSDTALRQQIQRYVDAFQSRKLNGIRKQLIELVAPPTSQQQLRRLGPLGLRENAGQRQLAMAFEFDVTAQPVSGLLGKVVQPGDRVEQRYHHQERRPFLLDEYMEVEVLLLTDRLAIAERTHLQAARD